MFGSKYLYDMFTKTHAKLAEVERDLAHERGKRESAERQLAMMGQTMDWLTQHVTELKVERAALFERVLNVGLPVASVEYTRPEPHPEAREIPRNVPVGLEQEVLRHLTPRVGPAYREPVNGKDHPALADLRNISFEDIGDKAANDAGITHDEAGEVQFE